MKIKYFHSLTSGKGRRSWDYLIIFRSLLLGVMNGLSDEQLQYMLLDRTSFKQFVGLNSKDHVPDQKTLWKYRDKLSQSGRIDELVAVFKEQLASHGYSLQTGTLVDSSVVQVPRQRNSREENATLKSGSVPPAWEDDPHKLRQKDTDARWFRKNGINHYGYKNHIAVDRDTKLITNWEVSAANVHDSQVFEELLEDPKPDGSRQVWADSAYRSQARIVGLREKGFKPRLNFKGKRGSPLTSRQLALNHAYSRVRVRVEHVFGAIKNETKGGYMNCLGLSRSRAWIGLTNLCYNIKRFHYLERGMKTL